MDKNLQQEPERAIVVGVGLKKDGLEEIKESLAELQELVETAGGAVIGSTYQAVESWNPAILIGDGKLNEIGEMIEATEAQLVVFDHSLSGVQSRNIEERLKVRVLDRSQLILDIFAQRAKSYEGQLQVELAQMLDQLPRMVHAWKGSLSRLGGGIGTRGPGETALEIDRRRIHSRVKVIRNKLETVRKNRLQHRALRQRHEIASFALIGYTNSGKSTLLNRLCHSQVYAEDQLFATLDPITRKFRLPSGASTVITDTVGFIRKLPHHLIEAFKATLEESQDADILLHVVDLSNPQMAKQVQIVKELIHEFGWDRKPIIHIFNKCDKAPIQRRFEISDHPRTFISALTGEGIDQLTQLMEETLDTLQREITLFFPKGEEQKIFELSRTAKILRKEEASTGTLCVAHLNPKLMNIWRDYLS